MQITLQQRLNLQGLLREQKTPPFTTDWDILTTVWKKIRLSDEESKPLMEKIQTPQGEMEVVTVAKLKQFGEQSIEVDLNYAEASKLMTLLKAGKYSPAESDWLDSLKIELEKVSQDPTKTK